MRLKNLIFVFGILFVIFYIGGVSGLNVYNCNWVTPPNLPASCEPRGDSCYECYRQNCESFFNKFDCVGNNHDSRDCVLDQGGTCGNGHCPQDECPRIGSPELLGVYNNNFVCDEGICSDGACECNGLSPGCVNPYPPNGIHECDVFSICNYYGYPSIPCGDGFVRPFVCAWNESEKYNWGPLPALPGGIEKYFSSDPFFCSDLHDNDCDGVIDCNDPDCSGILSEIGDGSNYPWCRDSKDNDCDGNPNIPCGEPGSNCDCDDSDCTDDPLCSNPPSGCTLIFSEIYGSCSPNCGPGDYIEMVATFLGDCNTYPNLFFQIDAVDNWGDPLCTISLYPSALIRGIFDYPSIFVGNRLGGTWTIQNIPEQCSGKTVYAQNAKLYTDDPALNGMLLTRIDSYVNGSFKFASSSDTCGDGIIDIGEQCDGSNWGPFITGCLDFDLFTGGTLVCDAECKYDTSSCTGGSIGSCGNGIIDTGETCDTLDLNGFTCLNFGFTGGTLLCDPNCDYDTSQCTTGEGPTCTLTSAYWNQTQAVEGDSVQLIVEGTGCDGTSVSFEIYEDDLRPLPDLLVKTLTGTFDRTTWNATWMEDVSGDPEYYFKATPSSGIQINSKDYTNGILHVSKNPNPPDNYCRDNQITRCANYPDNNMDSLSRRHCDDDVCEVAQNGIPNGTSCYWNLSSTPKCNPESSAYDPDDPYFQIGTCRWQDNTADTCDDDGFLTHSWTGEYIWNESNAYAEGACQLAHPAYPEYCIDSDGAWRYDPTGEKAKCVSGQRTVPCSAQVQLPFFNFWNVIGVIIGVVLIYIVWNRKTKKKSKR